MCPVDRAARFALSSTGCSPRVASTARPKSVSPSSTPSGRAARACRRGVLPDAHGRLSRGDRLGTRHHLAFRWHAEPACVPRLWPNGSHAGRLDTLGDAQTHPSKDAPGGLRLAASASGRARPSGGQDDQGATRPRWRPARRCVRWSGVTRARSRKNSCRGWPGSGGPGAHVRGFGEAGPQTQEQGEQ